MASILVVDDEPQNLELLDGVLAPTGHTIRTAGGGREALQAVEADPPDLILLDLMMPGVGGFEVCEMLRANPRTARIPVIIVTAVSQLGIKERALALGADDYLTKPIQPADVLARVEAMLRVRHLRQDLDRTLAYLHELELARHQRKRQTLAEMSVRLGVPHEAQGSSASAVLLVDDEELTRQFYGDMLVESGFRVVAAASGQEALAAVSQHAFEAVVLDIMMPGLSGLEALEAIRRMSPDLPVVILTAHPSSQNAIAALKLGAFDFVVKGLQHELVVLAVRRAVQHLAQLRESRDSIGVLQARIRKLEARIQVLEAPSSR
jgi:two-component system cell cycle response regulator